MYEYRFAYVATSFRKLYTTGAPHATEIPFVVDTVAFAKNGTPDPKGLPAWPAYHTASDELMSFTARGPLPQADPWHQRLDVAERAAERAETARTSH